jgi:hypothetical protein
MRFDENAVSQGVEGTLSMLRTLGMLDPVDRPPVEYEVFYGRHWIRAEDGGIFQSQRELGDRVVAGTPMGTVTDPFTNEQSTIYARSTGRIIGRALDQVVIPGFALYHIGTARATNGREEEPSETAEEMAPELDERPE